MPELYLTTQCNSLVLDCVRLTACPGKSGCGYFNYADLYAGEGPPIPPLVTDLTVQLLWVAKVDGTDKPDRYEAAYQANYRRKEGERRQQLQRRRSKWVERSFAHVCETAGGRRTRLRGVENNRKQSRLRVTAHNLVLIVAVQLATRKLNKQHSSMGCQVRSVRFTWHCAVATSAFGYDSCPGCRDANYRVPPFTTSRAGQCLSGHGWPTALRRSSNAETQCNLSVGRGHPFPENAD